MRTAYNESLRPSRALLQHSSSQIGSIVWPARPNDGSSHTRAGPPNNALRLRLGAGPLAVRLPPERRAAEKENWNVHEPTHDHRLQR
jgi:hypothetical protein